MTSHVYLAAALALLGRDDDARSAARDGLALNPCFTIARAESAVPYQGFAYSAAYPVILEGLRNAGLPER